MFSSKLQKLIVPIKNSIIKHSLPNIICSRHCHNVMSINEQEIFKNNKNELFIYNQMKKIYNQNDEILSDIENIEKIKMLNDNLIETYLFRENHEI